MTHCIPDTTHQYWKIDMGLCSITDFHHFCLAIFYMA